MFRCKHSTNSDSWSPFSRLCHNYKITIIKGWNAAKITLTTRWTESVTDGWFCPSTRPVPSGRKDVASAFTRLHDAPCAETAVTSWGEETNYWLPSSCQSPSESQHLQRELRLSFHRILVHSFSLVTILSWINRLKLMQVFDCLNKIKCFLVPDRMFC